MLDTHATSLNSSHNLPNSLLIIQKHYRSEDNMHPDYLQTTLWPSNHVISADLPQPPPADQSLLICPNIPNQMLANPSSVITDDDDYSRSNLAAPNTASEMTEFIKFLRNSPSLGDSLSMLLINACSLVNKLHCPGCHVPPYLSRLYASPRLA